MICDEDVGKSICWINLSILFSISIDRSVNTEEWHNDSDRDDQYHSLNRMLFLFEFPSDLSSLRDVIDEITSHIDLLIERFVGNISR